MSKKGNWDIPNKHEYIFHSHLNLHAKKDTYNALDYRLFINTFRQNALCQQNNPHKHSSAAWKDVSTIFPDASQLFKTLSKRVQQMRRS